MLYYLTWHTFSFFSSYIPPSSHSRYVSSHVTVRAAAWFPCLLKFFQRSLNIYYLRSALGNCFIYLFIYFYYHRGEEAESPYQQRHGEPGEMGQNESQVSNFSDDECFYVYLSVYQYQLPFYLSSGIAMNPRGQLFSSHIWAERNSEVNNCPPLDINSFHISCHILTCH